MPDRPTVLSCTLVTAVHLHLRFLRLQGFSGSFEKSETRPQPDPPIIQLKSENPASQSRCALKPYQLSQGSLDYRDYLSAPIWKVQQKSLPRLPKSPNSELNNE